MKDFKNDVRDLISLLKNLPNTVRSLEFESSDYIDINIRDMVIPESLKEIKEFDKIYICTNKYLMASDEYLEFEKYSTIFNHLNKFKLPNNIKIQSLPSFKCLTWLNLGDNFAKKLEINYLPSSLLYLRLGKAYSHIIQKDLLPENLQSLVIGSNYSHPTIELPPNLKSLCFEMADGNRYLKLSILKCIPNSVTNLDLSAKFTNIIDSLSNRLPFGLKRLKVASDVTNDCFKPKSSIFNYFNSDNSYINGFPMYLTHLNISIGDPNIQYLNPSHFPSTLKVLKLKSFFPLKPVKGEGFPASLTSIDCDSHILSCPFKNPSNIVSVKLHFSYSCYRDSSFLSSKFPNIKSMKTYSYIRSDEFQFNPIAAPESVTNLEMITFSMCNVAQNIKFSSNNIKSLRLNGIQTYSIFYNIFKQQQQQQQQQIPSPFPSCCSLLDLDFTDPIYGNRNPPPVPFNVLPKSLKILIIRGNTTPKLLLNSSNNDNNLEFIFISDKNKSINNHSIYLPIQIITFNEDEDRKTNRSLNSKLYRKLKRYINII